MRQILIEYLPSTDRNSPAYKAAKAQIQSADPFMPNNGEEFIELLENMKSDEDSVMITILSHGHKRGITFGTYESLISWCELCEKINNVRTNFPITLNLIAVCNSYQLIPYKKVLGHKIDRIWVSTDTVNSIKKGLLASNDIYFDNFIAQLDDIETKLYKEII